MAAFGEHLYAGTINFKRGFQLWRTRAAGNPPYDWECVLSEGAGRGPLNQGVVSLAAFKDALYIGSGIQSGGIDSVHKVGPAAPELIRLSADGHWDLLVGTPRDTADGARPGATVYAPQGVQERPPPRRRERRLGRARGGHCGACQRVAGPRRGGRPRRSLGRRRRPLDAPRPSAAPRDKGPPARGGGVVRRTP
jgi:hypothetical protein